MITRKLKLAFWLLLAPAISRRLTTCNAFTFVLSSQPSQCQSLAIQWSEGKGPYRLFLVPVGHLTPETRTVVNMQIPDGRLSTSLTLKFPENSQFVATMSDSTGFGAGGTSSIYTVGGGPSDCLPTNNSKADFFMYTNGKAPSQCDRYCISWDPGVTSPVHIYGIIPGGQSFDLGAPSSDARRLDWTTNVREGTQMLFLAVGGNNENGGSTDIFAVGGGSNECINGQSPSSTAGPAAGSVSTGAQSASGTGVVLGTTNSGATVTVDPGGTATANSGGITTVGGTTTGNGHSATGGSAAPMSSGPTPAPTNGSSGGTVSGGVNMPTAMVNTGNTRRSVNLGAIIGGTLGGIAVVILLILIWLMCADRRNDRRHEDRERLMNQPRTDLLADSGPMLSRNQSYNERDWFRAEPFIPPMSADEFARRTGAGHIVDRGSSEPREPGQSMSSLDHGALTNSSAAAAMYAALARTSSYSTSGQDHRSSHSHSQNISHSTAHSMSHRASSHGHSRSMSNPFSFTTSGRRDSIPLTPPTPMSAADQFVNPVTRPPPSSWHNQASTSANVVPRARRSASTSEPAEGKSGEEAHGSNSETDIVDIPPSYMSIRSPRVRNPDLAE